MSSNSASPRQPFGHYLILILVAFISQKSSRKKTNNSKRRKKVIGERGESRKKRSQNRILREGTTENDEEGHTEVKRKRKIAKTIDNLVKNDIDSCVLSE